MPLRQITTEKWLFRCSCGNTKEIRKYNVLNGSAKSCGCLHKEQLAKRNKENAKHGLYETEIYRVWSGMMERCYQKSCKDYKRYGARGITVCDSWHDAANFHADMGGKPKGLTLDRIDNNGPYSPDNCKWSTPMEQANNRRNSIKVNGMSLTQLEERTGISRKNLYYRHKTGDLTNILKERMSDDLQQ